jgi:hypothetical protein
VDENRQLGIIDPPEAGSIGVAERLDGKLQTGSPAQWCPAGQQVSHH